MRKHLVLLCAVFALFACGKVEPEVETHEVSEISVNDIVFDFTVKYPAETKASKQGWESGDAVFVFFEDYTGFFVKLTYNGSEWVSSIGPEYTFMPDTMTTEGKTVTAVYRPFGNSATPKYEVGGWYFPETQYTYYMAAEKEEYSFEKVSGQWVLTATLNMLSPEGYVQLFIEDGEAIDGGYTLGCDAVIPVGVASIGVDGTITETSDKTAADDMLGYAYNGGYLFSGKLTAWGYGSNYYFAKTKTADGTRADYFVSGKTLASHSAVKLPANDNVYALQYGTVTPNKGKWIPVGSGISVTIGNFARSGYSEEFNDFGTWQTCNYGSTTPEGIGTKDSFYGANGIAGITLPTRTQCETIINGCSWTTVTIHGKIGVVVHPNSGFLFLPMWVISPTDSRYFGQYWTSSTANEDKGYYLDFIPYSSIKAVSKTEMNSWCAIRAIQN